MKYATLLLALMLAACTTPGTITILHSDNHSEIQIDGNESLLILPIEESAPGANITYITKDGPINLNVHLAVNNVDYTMPLYLDGQKSITVRNLDASALTWEALTLSNKFEAGEDKYRPAYHFAPEYGWMNDPNGMVYKDGEYHLFYQHNPYGSMWGNMHWGHAVSRDLVDWEQLPVAIIPDKNGTVYSGSAIVDFDNRAGFGKDAIVAFYTSKSSREAQSVAYSLDNGRTFEKYENNPVLTSTEKDFRDPKVIYHKESNRYIMALAVGQNIEFYSSENLLEWKFESKFGEEYGVHGTGYAVWECPDLVELEVQNSDEKRWVLLVNINGHGPSGGSATQYFIGDFDGKEFTCEDEKEQVKWQDYGRDHYATVTWSNSPDDRVLAIAWMNNWWYATRTPTKWFRSTNSIVRSLSLFSHEGELYLASTPVKELEARRVATEKVSQACEVNFTLQPSDIPATFSLTNTVGESVDFTVDFEKSIIIVDKTKAGDTSFSDNFAVATPAPIFGEGYHIQLYIDVASVECFVNGGKSSLTNTLYPTQPYDNLVFGAECIVENLNIYDIK